MMVNREACNVRCFFTFLQRQLLTVRLNNPWWWSVLGHGLATSLALIFTSVCLVCAVVSAQWTAAAWLVAALVVYWVSMFLLLIPMEWCVRRIVRARAEPTTAFCLGRWLRVVLAIPMTQIIYPAGLLSTCFIGTHLWRGVRYDFRGPSPVRVTEDCSGTDGSVIPADSGGRSL